MHIPSDYLALPVVLECERYYPAKVSGRVSLQIWLEQNQCFRPNKLFLRNRSLSGHPIKGIVLFDANGEMVKAGIAV